MSRIINRVGLSYGHLVVQSFAGNNARGQSNWNCLCDCGKQIIVFGGNLHSGHTTSCGCRKGLTKHGENRVGQTTAEYRTLAGMIARCTNPNHPSYHLYGGRGIKVFDGWNSMEKYAAFLEHVGRRPSRDHSIDRWPDKNGNYEPGNVRWATDMEQNANTRKNKFITVDGKSMHLAEVSRQRGIAPATLSYRLRHGWSVEEALSIP